MDYTPKKRGRKPKNINRIIEPKVNNTISPIITHLPITLSDQNSESDIFIKDENKKFEDKDEIILNLKNEIKSLKNKMKKKNNTQSCSVYELDLKSNSNMCCWWCRHPFNTPKVELPTKYHNDKFYSYGNFCSYECCEAYNIDLNDEDVFKRSSLLKFHYYKTFGEFKNIIKAKDWKILIPFGGILTIDEYRKSFLKISEDYNYLLPPMISRHGYIEKINLLKDESNTNELIIKRNKPLKNNNNLLDTIIKSC